MFHKSQVTIVVSSFGYPVGFLQYYLCVFYLFIFNIHCLVLLFDRENCALSLWGCAWKKFSRVL